MSFKNIPFGTFDVFNVVIEIPDGSRNKYEYDEAQDKIILDFVFSETFRWPYNYGYVPQTRGGDGDALDAVVFSNSAIESGTVVPVRAVGMIELLDRGEVDNKLLTIPAADQTQAAFHDLPDLPAEYRERLEQLFIDLAREKQKKIEVLGFRNKERALKELKQARIS
ncbi:MAG: inorganic diphosphatase [Candidatus Andersenbacteria bacterium]|nr:inorganic diphosphatase [Candidatus Andersenbacteria bacterium]MBI3250395.1 inorganic diphosphatase [Candidatus Andersenbacteria bacterium]